MLLSGGAFAQYLNIYAPRAHSSASVAFTRLRRVGVKFWAEPGWLFPERRYLEKNSTGYCSGLIFEGYTTEALAECPVPTK